jgi:hypothetical protein
VHYFLTHPDQLTAVGGLGVVFTGGEIHQTNITTDGGQFQQLDNAYLGSSAALAASWHPGCSGSIRGYRIAHGCDRSRLDSNKKDMESLSGLPHPDLDINAGRVLFAAGMSASP